MISHYESMYGVLSNVSFCVLEDSNIIKPSKNVNENVIFY
jgi:predicted transcriptional regulator